MIEGSPLVSLAAEPVENFPTSQRRSHGQIATRQTLAQTHKVWADTLMLAGEELPRATKARRHLVRYHKHAMLSREFPHALQEAWLVRQNSRSPLNERLDDHRAELPGRLSQGLVYLFQHRCASLRAGWVIISVWRIDEGRLEQQRAEDAVKSLNAAKRDRAYGVAMIAVSQGQETRAATLALVVEKLVRHFQSHLHRRGSAVAVENFVKPSWGHPHQPLGQLDARRRRVTQQRGMGDLAQLPGDGLVYLLDAMAMQVTPQAGEPVNEPLATLVYQFETLSRDDNATSLVGLRHPLLHLRKRMPHIFIVPPGQQGQIRIFLVKFFHVDIR